MLKLWRHRQWFRGALSEIGCGLLTVILVTAPLWVFTVSARGPRFAFAMLLGMVVVLVVLALGSKWLRRR